MVLLDGSGIGVADVDRVARGREPVAVAEAVMARLAEARAALDRAAAAGQSIYGLNTGLGANLGTAVEGDTAAFQGQLVRGRSIAVGEALPTDVVRAAMTARAAGLAKGGSGISPRVFAALVAVLNAGVHPVMPRWASIGAGDLGLMAAIGLCLIGEGEAELGSTVLPAGEALVRAGLAPVALGSKDGLSLLNAGSVAIGQAALVAVDAAATFRHQQAAAALTLEGLGANLSILEPRLQAARPAPGQVQAAASLRQLLRGSARSDDGARVPLQDPLSVRCVPSIHGALLHAIGHAREVVETELGSAADNPLVLPDGRVLSTGNFHAPALALAFETLGLAIAQAAAASAARFVQLTGSGRNGLPRYLSPRGGASAGFVPLQKTLGSLVGAIRHAANPVMLDFLPVSEGVEDHATQAPLAVDKCAGLVGLWRRVVALEMLAAAQAVDLRPGHRLGSGTAGLHAGIRRLVEPLDEDRPLGRDADRLHAWLLEPEVSP